eukprot:1461655-Pleurochrysis_carterae.AAC.1
MTHDDSAWTRMTDVLYIVLLAAPSMTIVPAEQTHASHTTCTGTLHCLIASYMMIPANRSPPSVVRCT